jgi:hypothetical protein
LGDYLARVEWEEIREINQGWSYPSEDDRERAELPCDILVKTPLGRTVVACRIALDCEIQVGRETLPGDLIIMVIEDYDVIFGMDWLSKYGTQMDCKNKSIQFIRPSRDVLSLRLTESRSRSFDSWN